MKIITPDYILTNGNLISNMSIAFTDTIHKIDTLDKLKKEFKNADIITLKKNSLLMPGLINTHIHLEFSANKSHLKYGSFLNWLYSVIDNRDELMSSCTSECISNALSSILNSGTTTIGAISSYGLDLEACEKTPLNVIYFNELIGSQAVMADTLFNDFLSRLNESKKIKRKGFYPAVAIHSPYSVHPVLIKKAMEIVKNENLKLTAHFMESKAERDWLDASKGEFKDFFKDLLNQDLAVGDASEFLSYFNDYKTLFTHCVYANEDELNKIKDNKHTIIHCPISNRLLGNQTLNIKKLNDKKIRWIVSTDGLSSNYKLNLFEEMKISLFMHSDASLLMFSKMLIDGVTINPALALGLNKGEIKEGKDADMIVLDLDKEPCDDLEIHIITNEYNVSKIYINGNLEKDVL